ncbi:MAG: choice-of-anchor B family protein [Gemmatimonadetes bacterium]|nr:choice-of-anchor B family protein [Gemmatimonadota bacterium]
MTRPRLPFLLAAGTILLSASAARAQSFPGAPAALQAGFGASVEIAGADVLVGEAQNRIRSGLVYVYRKSGGAWTEQARLAASDAEGTDGFGAALAADGDLLAVTRLGGAGALYLFERDGSGTWGEAQKLTGSDAAEGDGFGASVALSGGHLLVGAPNQGMRRGAVYAFRRNADGAWTEVGKMAAADLRAADGFGTQVALHGDEAFVAAPLRDQQTGAVFRFRFQGNRWTEVGPLPLDGLERGVRFGNALSAGEDRLLVGAARAAGQMGAAFAFVRDADSGEWVPAAQLLPFLAGPRETFGSAVAYAGAQIWVGAPGAAGAQGAAYVYSRGPSGQFDQVSRLSPGVEGRTGFGGSLAVDGDLAAVGMTAADFGLGRVAVYERGADGVWQSETLMSEEENFDRVAGGQVDCAEGSATAFACTEVDLLSFVPVAELGGGRGVRLNDIWGWTDADTEREYAIVGRMDGTAFVDVTDPFNPVYLGNLPLTDGANPAAWRDMKVYRNHTFIVSDGAGSHGMQVFDLTRLRDFDGTPETFEADALYTDIHSAHNIVINEETGFAYSVGSSMGGETCGGGLHMIDVRDPKNPTFAGCFADAQTGRASTGYSHDAQCVVYRGPDAEHEGKEICFGANETALSIADVTDKSNPVALSRASYPNVGYSHQGWLTEDQRYFFMNDELDELQGAVEQTRTLIWDVSDLDDPQLVKEHFGTQKSSDHNLYIVGDRMYQSNYQSGLRVLDISDVENPVEVGYFDTVPYGTNDPGFGGSWSNYPFFKNGVVAVTSGAEGLFLVRPRGRAVF